MRVCFSPSTRYQFLFFHHLILPQFIYSGILTLQSTQAERPRRKAALQITGMLCGLSTLCSACTDLCSGVTLLPSAGPAERKLQPRTGFVISGSQLRMQAASHPELHSCMQQFKNCLVGLQCANFSHLQPFSVLQPVAPKPGGFSSGSGGCCRGDH